MTNKERLRRLSATLGRGRHALRLTDGRVVQVSTEELLDVFIELMDIEAHDVTDSPAPKPQYAHCWPVISQVAPAGGSAKIITILQGLIAQHGLRAADRGGGA